MISIIMPVYNGEPYLRQSIESVIAQRYTDWELIVVDDGSTDSTAAIVQAYVDSEAGSSAGSCLPQRIRYCYQENRGQAAALNHGLRLARGEFVTTLDSDDWLPADSLFDRVNYLSQHPEYGAVYADGTYCNAAGETVLRFSEHMPVGIEGDVYDTLIISPFYGTGATVLVRREVLRQHNIQYDEEIVWCQDWDFYIRLAEKTHFGFVSTPAIFYRLHGAGMTLTMPAGRRLESLLRLRHKVMASPRFDSVTEAHKAAFFYDFLIKDLHHRIQDQEAVFESAAYNKLARSEQSRLMRLTANSYLLEMTDKRPPKADAVARNEADVVARNEADVIARNEAILIRVKKWLRVAWQRAPFNPKTAVMYIFLLINPKLARQVILKWKTTQKREDDLSPFVLTGADQKSITAASHPADHSNP